MNAQLTRTAVGPNDPDDGDQCRQQRGLAIAILAQEHIRPDKFGYKVPSQSGNGAYLVNLEHGPYCTCPDFEKRNAACKHVYAVEALLQRTERLDEEPPQAVRITQPWAAYNDAQVHEGELFAILLRSLCDTVPQPPQANGRPQRWRAGVFFLVVPSHSVRSPSGGVQLGGGAIPHFISQFVVRIVIPPCWPNGSRPSPALTPAWSSTWRHFPAVRPLNPC